MVGENRAVPGGKLTTISWLLVISVRTDGEEAGLSLA